MRSSVTKSPLATTSQRPLDSDGSRPSNDVGLTFASTPIAPATALIRSTSKPTGVLASEPS